MGNFIGERIRQYRAINNLSQENVADELKMTNGNYGKIERGEIDINSTHLIALADLFKIEVGDFFSSAKSIISEPKEKIGFVSQSDFNNLVELVKKLTLSLEEIKVKKVKGNNKYSRSKQRAKK